MSREIKRQRTVVGSLQRKIERKAASPGVRDYRNQTFAKVRQVIGQTANEKAPGLRTPKLYSWQGPEVQCINKGKSRNPFEFGAKVGIALTYRSTLIVGARAFAGNPFDGHTLAEQLEQAAVLIQDTVDNDLGYRGVDHDNPQIYIRHRGNKKTLGEIGMILLKRRQAIEPIIGHMNADHRLNQCQLKGEIGDRIQAVLCVAGHNIRWLLRMIANKGMRAFLRLPRIAPLILTLRTLARAGNENVHRALGTRGHSMA